MANPWALIRNAETPLETSSPTPWAPVPEDPAQQSDTSSRNLVSHLGGEGQGKALPVEPALAPEIQNTQDQLQKVRYAQTHPWGTVENHPGKIGKIAHIFSEIGNIAGNIVAPGAMSMIPGSQLNMQDKEAGLTHRLERQQEQSATEQQQAATTGHLNAETPEVAPNAESTRKFQGQEGENLASEIKMREHPLPEYEQVPGMLTPTGQPVDFEKHSAVYAPGNVEGLHYGKAMDKLQHVAGTLNGTPTQADFDPVKGIYTNPDTGQQIFGFKPQLQAAMMGPVVVSPGGEVSRATPGKTLPEGFRTVSQGGSQNIPTSQMRNMGEMAATVLPMADNVVQEVQHLAQSIGPAAGRWNDLMVNKGGKDFPEFAGLDQDLDLLSSAIVRTHFGARGGQQYREELRKMLGAAQSPDDLVSRIQHADSWLRGYAHAGGANVPEGVGTGAVSPAGAKVLKFNAATGRLE